MNPLMFCTIMAGLWIAASVLTGFTKWYRRRRANFHSTADFYKMLAVQVGKIAVLLGSIMYVAIVAKVASALKSTADVDSWSGLGLFYCFFAFVAVIYQVAKVVEPPTASSGMLCDD